MSDETTNEAKNGKAQARKPRAGKQLKIAGTERKDIVREIETDAMGYVEIRDERMELTEREGQAKQKLLHTMEKHGRTSYRCDAAELLVEVMDGERNVKVRKVKDEPQAAAE